MLMKELTYLESVREKEGKKRLIKLYDFYLQRRIVFQQSKEKCRNDNNAYEK